MIQKNIKNLVIQGGGVLGIAYAGAIQVLEEKNILENIERTAGTSAGAILSTLVSLRYTSAEITEIIHKTDFVSFQDAWNPFRIISKYGLYSGNTFLSWLEKQVTGKGLAKNATFADFKNAGCRDLHVFAADLNVKNIKEFSFATTPQVVVAEAVRASMSIPLFFKAWQFRNNNPDNHIYVDGGIVFNYPITIFDSIGSINTETLGLHLDFLNGTPIVTTLRFNQFSHYVVNLFETMLKAQVVDFVHDKSELNRSVRIDCLGVSATNFKITDLQKKQLFESGVRYTKEYLNKTV